MSASELTRAACTLQSRRQRRSAASWLALAACGLALGCDDDDTRRLDPISVAMTSDFAPIYSDNELTIYETKTSLTLPIVAPRPEQLDRLGSDGSDPFERMPWVEHDDVRVQVTWTLSNLDASAHNVWVMVDPWNEFGRYEPALHVSDDEAMRDFSGIDMLFALPGLDDAEAPRIVGTFTFDDMDELAVDFATVFKILADAAPVGEEDEDPRSTLINHAFNPRERTYRSPLLEPYRPSVVPGLVGFDFGLRTSEPANVALEMVVELRDEGDRIAGRGESVPLLEPPQAIISAAAAP
jgi:hypothetical protein